MALSLINETPYHLFSERLHAVASANTIPVSGSLELTYRCNLNCLHCYCNLPATDHKARESELRSGELREITDQLAEAGCLWLLVTGGECLVRRDFRDIWGHAKRRGMILTLFTNATLVNEEAADFLAEFPPFSIEVTCYGATAGTYEQVTRRPGSHALFMRGVDLILSRGLPLTLKAMALTANLHEIPEMERFAAGLGIPFRLDALLNSRLDGRAGPEHCRIEAKDVVDLDVKNNERRAAWEEFLRLFSGSSDADEKLFTCGAGVTTFNITPQGMLQGCSMVNAPCRDLRHNSFREAWEALAREIRAMEPSGDYECGRCPHFLLCSHCPGWSLVETGQPDAPVPYLCAIATERARRFVRV